MHAPRILALLLSVSALSPSQDVPRSPDEFFGLDRIWDIHLKIKRDDWVGMFPAPRGPDSKRMRFFGKFSYTSGDVSIGSFKATGIGVRMKGNTSFAATAGTLKRSFKLDFDRNDPTGRFLGLTKLNLHCNALDGTQIKEAVSYQLYRDAGMVACRTCFARVFLTIPGEVERAYLGLYTVVEQVDRAFMARNLGDGLILKPEGETMAYRGPEWNAEYDGLYTPKSPTAPDRVGPVIATARLYSDEDDAAFAAGLEAHTDVDQFLRYTAVTTIIVNGDSPVTFDDNYYLVVPDKARKVNWIPWDLNWSMGGFNKAMGAPAADLSIMRPSAKEVFKRVLAVPRFRQRYRELLSELINGPCSAANMTDVVHKAWKTVEQARAEEAKRDDAVTKASKALGGEVSAMGRMFQRRSQGDDLEALLQFVRDRARSVNDQLAGKSQGRVPGRSRRSVPGFQARDLLAGTGALSPSQEGFTRDQVRRALGDAFKKADQDGDGAIDDREVATILGRHLKAIRGEVRRGQEGLVRARTRRAMTSLDQNGDGGIGPDEWRAGILKLLPGWDRDDDGSWSREELNIVKLN